mmetsp:Transcript_8439/g.21037  ORF Transcript_8439/g.21037 Transcript_8439/m.21037 type:complete len:282 (+) Transcript_8439:1157-2002(+)
MVPAAAWGVGIGLLAGLTAASRLSRSQAQRRTPVLEVSGLSAEVVASGSRILDNFSLSVYEGELHVLMGPNGCGKSTLAKVLAGHPDYVVTGGSIKLHGNEIRDWDVEDRSRQGLFLALQAPPEVPGVPYFELMSQAISSSGGDAAPIPLASRFAAVANHVGVRQELLSRCVNDGFSGGERKRMEIVQGMMLNSSFGVFDELDSGLDVDGLRQVAACLTDWRGAPGKGVLIITHYLQLLDLVPVDWVHVLQNGRIMKSEQGVALANKLARTGFLGDEGVGP